MSDDKVEQIAAQAQSLVKFMADTSKLDPLDQAAALKTAANAIENGVNAYAIKSSIAKLINPN